MTTSQRGLDLIKQFEGLRLTAYQDSVDIWTIGYGHTGGVLPFDTITEERAEALLRLDVHESELVVNTWVKVPLTQNQFDSLVSFVFNIGPGKQGVKDGFISLKNGRRSTILTRLNQRDYPGAAAEFEKWSKAGGKVLPGLLKRRLAERDLFLDAGTP